MAKRKKLQPRRRTISDCDVSAIADDTWSEGASTVAVNCTGDGNDDEGILDVGDDREVVSEDDCEVIADDDFDEAVDDVGNETGDGEANEDVGNGLGIEEEGCQDLAEDFREAARNDEVESDADSGDDIWNDHTIPDPLSSDDDEEEVEPRQNEDPEEIIALGKTYGCADDFKLALLRYSLKTRYDIKMYKSTSMKLGAKCSDTEVKCPWRIYCSYEKSKRKMQVN